MRRQEQGRNEGDISHGIIAFLNIMKEKVLRVCNIH
jgi:hypothetical protein